MAAKAKTQSNTITNGQIGQICDRLTTKFRESHLPVEAVQSVLREPGGAFIDEMFGIFRARVEAQSNMIVRRTKVNRSLTPQEMLDETGRRQYTDRDVIATIPQGEGEEVDVYFFNPGRYVPVAELAKEYELRGLKIDPAAQAAVNRDDPSFADERPNGSQWQDAQGEYCCATFDRWGGERVVHVDRDDRGWSDGWWFAGVRK